MTQVTWTGGEEHWTNKGDARLFMWHRKRREGTAFAGTLFFVHGSSMASQPTFDLTVPGRADSSAMQWFADRGFDTWTMDHEGYGRSSKHRAINSDIANGADDLLAATQYIRQKTGAGPMHYYGISSGALRAALFAQRHPEHVAKLVLDAFVWTGKDSHTLENRRKKLPEYQALNRRPIDRAFVQSIFDRDHPGTADQATISAFADAILTLDSSMPTGTYVDMCSRLPVVDPTQIKVPTLILRGEFDGIASMQDLIDFYVRLPHTNKQFSVMKGISHASFQQKNYKMVYHILHSYLTMPDPIYEA
jgi:pimeloyl-ACP methyl ester carboxylesterase